MTVTHSTYTEAKPDENGEPRLTIPARHFVDLAALSYEEGDGFDREPFLPFDVDEEDIDLRDAIDPATVDYEDDCIHMCGSTTVHTAFAWRDDRDVPHAGEAEIAVTASFRFGDDGRIEALSVTMEWV